jgi:hypothetical protein
MCLVLGGRRRRNCWRKWVKILKVRLSCDYLPIRHRKDYCIYRLDPTYLGKEKVKVIYLICYKPY